MEILKIEIGEQLLKKYHVIKHLILLKIQYMMDINMDLLQWFINLLIKNIQKNNEKLAKELHKPIIRESGKRKIHSVFTQDIWGTDLTDIQLISKVNIGFRFLLFVINILEQICMGYSFKR